MSGVQELSSRREASTESFFDRLDTFSIARLLKITLVLLFFGETHYLPSLRASLAQELTQRRSSSAQIGPILMQKSDPPLGTGRMRALSRQTNLATSNNWVEPAGLVVQK